jgi:5-methylcytosine-specific restriction endonuclease McrA
MKFPKRKRLEKLSKINARLWKSMAEYVKERDGHKCVTCGSTERLQASHFIHGNCFDFNEIVVNTQCDKCHLLFGKNPYQPGELIRKLYREYLERNWGKETIDNLVTIKHAEYKPNRTYYEEVEEWLKGKMALLMTNRVLR